MERDSRRPLYRYGFALLLTAGAVALRLLLSSALGALFLYYVDPASPLDYETTLAAVARLAGRP